MIVLKTLLNLIFRSIQIVTSSQYSNIVSDIFPSSLICVLRQHILSFSNETEKVLQNIMELPETKVIVLFLDTQITRDFINTLETFGEELILIDVFGQIENINSFENIISLREDFSATSEDLETMKTTLNLHDQEENTLFQEYFQDLFECDLKNSFRFGKDCTHNHLNESESK